MKALTANQLIIEEKMEIRIGDEGVKEYPSFDFLPPMDNEEAFNEKYRLGKGGFSEIFKGIRLNDGHSVATKKVKRTLVRSQRELLATIKGRSCFQWNTSKSLYAPEVPDRD